MTDTPKAVTAQIYIVVDGDGRWASMGHSEAPDVKTPKELKSLLREWNLEEGLGFTKCYKIMVDIPLPNIEDIKRIWAKFEAEDQGMVDEMGEAV